MTNVPRKIVAGLFMSLDGVVDAEAASPHVWANAEMMDVMAAGLAQADAVLFGPRTYRLLAQSWQNQSNDIPMANFLNNSPKYVVSHGAQALDWQPATLITGDVRTELAKLKEQPGKNIQVPGSPLLVRSLLRDGLLDELYLNICPVVIGSGMHLFDEITASIQLRLTDSRTYSNGVLGVAYEAVR
jgi:dihydrofolate reductase